MADIKFTKEELEHEEWRPVSGYESHYEISSLGRLKAINCYKYPSSSRILRPGRTSNGYLNAVLCVNWGRKNRSIHSLVAEEFIGPRPSGFTVNHIDGDKTNNRKENLEYLSSRDNTRHAAQTGLKPSGDLHWARTQPQKLCRGKQNGASKLNDGDIPTIRLLLSQGATYAEIASRYGVTRSAIGRIKRGQGWSHIS